MDDRPDETAMVLGSELYARAFEAVASGTDPGLLPDDERAVLVRARELTGTTGPGYPMPSWADPTRSAGSSDA